MKKSHNILIVNSIGIMPHNFEHCITMRADIELKIEAYCPITKNKFIQYTIVSEGESPIQNEALRQAIENIFNGNVRITDRRFFDVPIECFFNRHSIHHIDYSEVPEPLRSVFAKMFGEHQNSDTTIKLPAHLNIQPPTQLT